MQAHTTTGDAMKKFALIGAVAALSVSIPAAAEATSSHHLRGHHDHPCRLHDDRYSARGTLVSWSLTPNANGTYSGSLVVDVLHGNRHATGEVGSDTTYTVTDAVVRFGPHATVPPVAGSRIRVLGRALVTGRRCTGTGSPTTDSYAISHIEVHAPAKSAS
jgi:hypothetical protein